MLAGTITSSSTALEQQAGGNVIVFAAGGGVLDDLNVRLEDDPAVRSYALVGMYNSVLIRLSDGARGAS